MSVHDKIEAQRKARDVFLSRTDRKSFDFLLCTWFGSGLIIPAPGTWGTIGGLVVGLPLMMLTGGYFLFLLAVLFGVVGYYAVDRLEKKLDDHDPSFIVIDEVVAIWLCLAFLPASQSFVGAGAMFVLFRFFDAKKPWLVGRADRNLKGAAGVMVDDLVAAVFAIAVYYAGYFLLSL